MLACISLLLQPCLDRIAYAEGCPYIGVGVGVGAGGGGAEQKAGGTGIQRSHYKEKEDPLHPS
jgi:hypothetical protein